MRFQKYGRTYQLRIESADDLNALLGMDETLWVATSAPVASFRCDPKLLAILDTDANGRICSDDLKAAIRWLLARLADPSQLAAGVDWLPLAAIKADTPEGKALVDSARYVLAAVPDAPDERISLPQVRGFLATIQARPVNGDGVISPEATSDPVLAAFIGDAANCTGGTLDLSGKKGVTEAQINSFLAAIPAYLAWRENGEIPADAASTPTMPFGADTGALHALYLQQASKVDLYFDLCRLGAFDARTASRLAGLDSHLQKLDPVDAAQVTQYLGTMPIAAPAPGKDLPLAEAEVNPIYRQWVRELAEKVLPRTAPDAPGDSLSEAEWLQVKAAFTPYEAYLASKAGGIVEALAPDALQASLAPILKEQALLLLAADQEVAGIVKQAEQVARLLLLHQHILVLANNFVSFPYLYSPDSRALFEMGSVIMDGRCLSFAVKVENAAEHSKMAKLSNLFVVYLEVTGAANEKFQVAVPVTSGTKGNLTVGKRGVFFDIHGKEYDARITQVIANPVSLREALALPFVRLWSILEGRIETWSTSSQKGLQTEFGKAMPPTTPGAKAPPPAKAPVPGQPRPANSAFVGLCFVTAALGSAFAFITKTFSGMNRQHVMLGLSAAIGLVVLPITLVAYLKLRRQDLSSLLEGGGWAINARMRLNRRQRRQFTTAYVFPAGAKGTPRRTHLLVFSIFMVLELAIWAALRWYSTSPMP
ncbi:MAG: hypothetical protein HN849_21310 [Victivallales bacterium]|nr:hypothetical protein [Victivallales bacterium]